VCVILLYLDPFSRKGSLSTLHAKKFLGESVPLGQIK
jgi:hypothetical protein